MLVKNGRCMHHCRCWRSSRFACGPCACGPQVLPSPWPSTCSSPWRSFTRSPTNEISYLLPLAVPAAWLSLLALPRRLWPWLVLLTIGCGFAFRGEPGQLAPIVFGRAADRLAKVHRTTFFVADFPEMDGAFVENASLDLLVARKEYDELRATQRQTATFEPTPEQVVAWLSLLGASSNGRRARSS